MNAKLQQLFEDYKNENGGSIHFNWDGELWCISGTTKEGIGWETDDCEASSLEEAEEMAIDYMENYE